MNKNERLPKAEYFKMRYDNAIENNLSSKAEYYKSRLVQMDAWVEELPFESVDVKTSSFSSGLVTRHEMDFGKGKSFVFYSA